jgi:Tfp pilus assembly major pilin PilA
MYQAVSYLSDGTGTVDTFTTPFGFRWFSWSGSQCFSLNGSHYWMQGGNVHQNHAGWGDGVADSALYRDVRMVKDAGMNFIRGSHYPKAPAFADACDQLGVLFWSENCFWANLTVSNGMPAQPAWRSGVSKWCMFDHGTQADPSYGIMGIVDYFRIPKRSYYSYRNAYAKVAAPTWPTSGTPAGLTLTSSTTTLSAVDGTQDA